MEYGTKSSSDAIVNAIDRLTAATERQSDLIVAALSTMYGETPAQRADAALDLRIAFMHKPSHKKAHING